MACWWRRRIPTRWPRRSTSCFAVPTGPRSSGQPPGPASARASAPPPWCRRWKPSTKPPGIRDLTAHEHRTMDVPVKAGRHLQHLVIAWTFIGSMSLLGPTTAGQAQTGGVPVPRPDSSADLRPLVTAFHVHSTASTGDLTLDQLAEQAEQLGLD